SSSPGPSGSPCTSTIRRGSTTPSASASPTCCARISASTQSTCPLRGSRGRCGPPRTSSVRSGSGSRSEPPRTSTAASVSRETSPRRRRGPCACRPTEPNTRSRTTRSCGATCWKRGCEMSREIIEAVRELEREKNLESGILVEALRDGLLAAYKKTPGAYRHATVEIDENGDFRVYAIHMPPDLEYRLLEEARERALDELERIEEETGEKQHTLISDDDLEIDWSQVPQDQIQREDVTPENFGRIAAQTAKQVIQQRIREAERQIMYEEYVDRVTEVVTGIVQQAGDRNNILVDLGKVEALL